MASEIRCPICKGSKRGRYGQTCGACFGMGVSTNPWEQPRNGTTVGLRLEDFQRAEIPDRGRLMMHTTDDMIAALNARHPGTMPDLQIHSGGTVAPDAGGRSKYVGILISWANPEYAERLAHDRQEVATAGAQS